MQLKYIGLLAMCVSLALQGCGESEDIIINTSPYSLMECEYVDYAELLDNSITVSYGNGLKIISNPIDLKHGAFAITLWRRGENIVVTGLPNKRRVRLSFIKRLDATNGDVIKSRIISGMIAKNCGEVK